MIINDKNPTDLSGFYIVYRGSVLNEDETNYGLSHLMEHLMCKMFKQYYTEFERYGINWNAYTSNNEVVFHMTGLDEYLYKYRHILVEALLGFEITEDEFLKEKNVVIQEYKDTFQDQSTSAYFNMLRKLYNNYGPIGKLESLEKITYQDVKDYWKKHLSKPSLIINISKNNEFKGYDDFNLNYPKKFIPKITNPIFEKMVDFKKVDISGYFKTNDDMNYIKFILDMLSQSFDSPFMDEIREKRGLTYGVGSFISKISDTEGLSVTSLITTDENVDEVLDTYKMILTQPEKYLTEDRFNTMKDFYTVKKKKDDINRYSRIDKYITPKNWQVETILDTITFDEIKDYYDKYFKFDNWNWIIDKKEF
ncbi:MAG: M16 family metallopeptidase [bacterium]